MKTICLIFVLTVVLSLNMMGADAQWDAWMKKTTKKPHNEGSILGPTIHLTKSKKKGVLQAAGVDQPASGQPAAGQPSAGQSAPANNGAKYMPDTATAPVRDSQRVQSATMGSPSAPNGGQSGQNGQLVKAEVLKKTGNLAEMLVHLGATSFVALLQQRNLLELLLGKEDSTVFVPTNEAMASLPKWGLRKITEDPNLLVLLLVYHIAPGKYGLANFTNGLKITTSQFSRPVHVGLYPNRIAVNNAYVTIPETIATNGVIHVINSAMFPIPNGTLFDVLDRCPSFSIFKKHVIKAGLDALLKFEANALTIFAPTNDAFELIPNRTNVILADESTAQESVVKVQALILHHIVKGVFFSPGFQDGEELVMAGGKEVLLGVRNDRLRDVGVARVIRPDISTVNGVVHAIDRFLIYDDLC